MAYPQASSSEAKIVVQVDDIEHQIDVEVEEKDEFYYLKRSQWLRAAVLGTKDGLVSTASLMIGVGPVTEDVKVMILSGFAGLIAGAFSMAIGEFVSAYSQLDIEVAQKEREENSGNFAKRDEENENLRNPLQAASASALAFSAGAIIPLLAASFIKDYEVRLGMTVVAVTIALGVFGWLVIAATSGFWLDQAIWFERTVSINI